MAQELLTTFEDELGGVTLVPGTGGVFVVKVGGDVVWSRKDEGRFPEITELKQRVARPRRARQAARTFGEEGDAGRLGQGKSVRWQMAIEPRRSVASRSAVFRDPPIVFTAAL